MTNSASQTPAFPAISLEKIQEAAPGLVDLYKSAGASLAKNRLGGARAAVYLVLDRSMSMRRYYDDGSVQRLAEQALGLAAHFDDDGAVPVVFFDSFAHAPFEVALTSYQGRIRSEHEARGWMGTTNYAAAMHKVIGHYRQSRASVPAFVIFQTDGRPDSEAAAEQALCEASALPMFWQFIGFGDDAFAFLKRLDTLEVPQRRLLDNAGFFEAGADPGATPLAELYDPLMAEFPAWLAAARAKGLVR
ncbi:VWA domain-containing protein [Spirillospora sp. CA-294931]|uniref:VWA domain-containing protein n=1 Tax=Spirillospora sp. CA-294931 TaxID=3240042 RepID=UPI003D939B79